MNYDGRTFRDALEEMVLKWEEDWDGAFEADLTTSTTNQPSTTETATTQRRQSNAGTEKDITITNNGQDYVARAKALGEKMDVSIEKERNRILKMLENVWKGNEQFIAEYNEMSQQYKLVDDLTVINWTYGHDMEQYLHSKVVKFRAILTDAGNSINNWQRIPDDSLLKKDKTAMMQAVIAQLGGPSSVDNMSEFIGHLRAQFRGRKSEKNYRGEMANKFMQEIRNFASTRTSFTQDTQAAQRVSKATVSAAGMQLRNTSFSTEDRQAIMKMLQAYTKLVALYMDVVGFVYRLEVEYILNRRAIMNRLFEK